MSDLRSQAGAGINSTGESNRMAVAGLVCGILGVAFYGIVLGILAIIFGWKGIKRADRGAPRRLMAKVAIGLGLLAIIDGVLFIALHMYYLG